MKFAPVFIVLAVCASLTVAPGVARAAAPPMPAAGPPQPGCFATESRPNFAAYPSGTRVYFMPVLVIRYSKPGVDVAEMRFAPENGVLQADVRANTIYVNGKKTQATVEQGGDTNFQARVQACIYPPGQPIPANFNGIPPDFVLR